MSLSNETNQSPGYLPQHPCIPVLRKTLDKAKMDWITLEHLKKKLAQRKSNLNKKPLDFTSEAIERMRLFTEEAEIEELEVVLNARRSHFEKYKKILEEEYGVKLPEDLRSKLLQIQNI